MEMLSMVLSLALVFVTVFAVAYLERWGGAIAMACAALVGAELLSRVTLKIEQADGAFKRLGLQVVAAAGFAVVVGYALLRLACDLPSPGQYLWRLMTPFGRAPIEFDLALLVAVLIPLWLRKQKGLRLKLVVPSIITVLAYFIHDWDLGPLMFWPTIFLSGYIFSEVCVAPKKFVSSSFHGLALIVVAVVSAFPPILASAIIAGIVSQFVIAAPRLWLRRA